jgi:hypothetical protein
MLKLRIFDLTEIAKSRAAKQRDEIAATYICIHA